MAAFKTSRSLGISWLLFFIALLFRAGTVAADITQIENNSLSTLDNPSSNSASIITSLSTVPKNEGNVTTTAVASITTNKTPAKKVTPSPTQSATQVANVNATQVVNKKVFSVTSAFITKLLEFKTTAEPETTEDTSIEEDLMLEKDTVITTLPTAKESEDEEYIDGNDDYDGAFKTKENLAREDTLTPQINNKDPANEENSDDYEIKPNSDSDTDEDSHFFLHLVIIASLIAVVYIAYHNKRKIYILIQRRRWRDSLCSKNIGYHRLDQNVNEAMPSLRNSKNYAL